TPTIREILRRQPGENDLQRFLVDLRGLQEVHVVVGKLVGRDAAPHSELEATAAQLIEHADLLDEAERRGEGQGVDERGAREEGRTLGERGEGEGRGGGHAARRRGRVRGVVRAG